MMPNFSIKISQNVTKLKKYVTKLEIGLAFETPDSWRDDKDVTGGIAVRWDDGNRFAVVNDGEGGAVDAMWKVELRSGCGRNVDDGLP